MSDPFSREADYLDRKLRKFRNSLFPFFFFAIPFVLFFIFTAFVGAVILVSYVDFYILGHEYPNLYIPILSHENQTGVEQIPEMYKISLIIIPIILYIFVGGIIKKFFGLIGHFFNSFSLTLDSEERQKAVNILKATPLTLKEARKFTDSNREFNKIISVLKFAEMIWIKQGYVYQIGAILAGF